MALGFAAAHDQMPVLLCPQIDDEVSFAIDTDGFWGLLPKMANAETQESVSVGYLDPAGRVPTAADLPSVSDNLKSIGIGLQKLKARSLTPDGLAVGADVKGELFRRYPAGQAQTDAGEIGVGKTDMGLPAFQVGYGGIDANDI